MHVEADVRGAVEDRREVVERIRAVLDRLEFAEATEATEATGLTEFTDPKAPGGPGERASALTAASVSDDVLRRPAAIEAVHTAQRALRSGTPTREPLTALAAVLGRFAGDGPPALGPAEPQDHLRRSVSRALRSIPARRRDDGAPVTAGVVGWDAEQRHVLVRAVDLLTGIWPEMVGELSETVAEVALLDGDAIDGFTDFTVHGVVLLHRDRLTTSASGLPGPVRCAEALVHEGTHNRCNAAAVAEPFLLPDPADGGATGADGGSAGSGGTGAAAPGALRVTTPLRADPRPLSGLFQQTVVLARGVLLYRRLAAPAMLRMPGTAERAVTAREARLTASARQAVDTLTAHSGALTDSGLALLGECAAVTRERP
ncbi:aKG-HExxH-type peptide beta-hydroxylase [Streptomyces sp. NBC_01429]|uniref:aKG-HExxH-type peptide beta-hydroxylase n=1 Tax=Streptomyces sp. NBC_01429 TaxID=2903862 RepID=UPI002E2971D6|nr:HEXXH motif-containing putative peptide modification protein [Streptomyces sp. NBC_01429]